MTIFIRVSPWLNLILKSPHNKSPYDSYSVHPKKSYPGKNGDVYDFMRFI
jgi:hypothetical protein